jgi:hypothetical protein
MPRRKGGLAPSRASAKKVVSGSEEGCIRKAGKLAPARGAGGPRGGEAKKVVSGRPASTRVPCAPGRRFGYNPVELSRLAVGIHALVIQSRGLCSLEGAFRRLDVAQPLFDPGRSSLMAFACRWHPGCRPFSPGFSTLARGFPVSACLDGNVSDEKDDGFILVEPTNY